MWNPDQHEQQSDADAAANEGLPPATFEWVWSTLGVRYGHFFAGKWDGFNMDMVKEDWRLKLGRLTDHQLQYGLDHLPEGRPPSDVGEFRSICLRAPAPKPQLALPPKRGPVQIPEATLAKFAQLQPKEDDEPQVVRGARHTIRQLEGRKVVSEVHRESLAAAHRVIRRHEAGLPTDEEEGNAVPPTA